MKLRPYQQALRDELFRGWDIHNPASSKFRRQFLQLPTGGGKTVVFNAIAAEFMAMDFPVMILAHREELIMQADEKFRRANPWHGSTDVIMSSWPRDHISKLKIGSVQTVSRRIDPDKLKFIREPQLIIVDEGHHATSDTYLKILYRFPNSLILYVSATPCRLDGSGFADVADRMICGPTVKELERMWKEDAQRQMGLVPDKIMNVQLSPKVRQVKKVRGDFDSKELNQILNSDEMCKIVVDIWKQTAEGRKTIVFCLKGTKGQEPQNERLARVFSEAGIPAACITAKTEKNERRKILDKYRKGEIRVLTNCEIATEGFDLPDLDCTILLRPTLSTSLYIQMVGRGKRPAGPAKSDHLIIDMSGNVAGHGTPNADRLWSLGGLKKVRDTKPMVNIQGQLFPIDQVPARYEGPIFYDIVELEEEYRVYHFEQTLQNLSRNGFVGNSAFYRSFCTFLKKVDADPSKLELQYIQETSAKHCSKPYSDKWANVMHQKFSRMNQAISAANSAHDIANLQVLLDKNFRFPPRGREKLGKESAGYTTLKKKVDKKAQQIQDKSKG